MSFKVVYIEWWDHASFCNNGWQTIEDLQDLDPCLFRSVGYLIKETPTYILVAGCIGHESDGKWTQNGKHTSCILKVAIKKRKYVKI
jgi:hypothetical protein